MLSQDARVDRHVSIAETGEQCVKIEVIDAWDALGYRGAGREEHSGETSPVDPPDLQAELADDTRRQALGTA